MFRGVFLFLLLLVGGQAFAGINEWSGSGSQSYTGTACTTGTLTFSTQAAANSGWVANTQVCATASFGSPCTVSLGTSVITPAGSGVYNLAITATRSGAACGAFTYNLSLSFTDSCSSLGTGYTFDDTVGSCVEPYVPPDCSEYAGLTLERFFTGASVQGPACAAPPGAEMDCAALLAEPTGVRFNVDGEGFGLLSFTGDQCGAEPDITGEVLTEQPGTTNCIGGGGVTVCAAESSRNCGTVNGAAVCLDSVPPGRCVFLSNGGMVCGSTADGPTESDGTTPATPDGTFSAAGEDAEEDDFRYFGPGTVAGSGTPVTGVGAPADGFTGEDEGEEGGEFDECGPDCTLEVPEVEDGEPADSVVTSAVSTLTGGSFGDVLDELRPDLGAGECPTASFEAWEQTFTFESHCDFMEDQRTIIGAIMLLVWAVLAFRILMET